MKQIVATQLAYQIALGNGPDSFDGQEGRMQYIRDTCLALNIEVAEFLQELPWKPWRPAYRQPCNIDKAAEELVDVIIFALNLWITLGWAQPGQSGATLEQMIKQKQKTNSERLTSGYNKTKTGETK